MAMDHCFGVIHVFLLLHFVLYEPVGFVMEGATLKGPNRCALILEPKTPCLRSSGQTSEASNSFPEYNNLFLPSVQNDSAVHDKVQRPLASDSVLDVA